MTNAERQQRWRDTHRPRKRKVVALGPGGRLLIDGQVALPPSATGMSSPSSTPSSSPPPVAATPSPPLPALEHNFCPHCGSCLKKRAKSPKLAA